MRVGFGHYELLERVSAGGMAEVYRARDMSRGGSIVALKRILPQIAEDEDFIAMFEDEARIAAQLEHPHIARMVDVGHVDREYFIAFEYVDGKDLRMLFDRCTKSRDAPPIRFLLYVFSRIAEGLSYAHSRKDANGQPVSLVHRDVSPQNIVVSFQGDVKLIDFGIAKAKGKLARTQAGQIKGKFGYMSPEQVHGREIDNRADIFSLGICFWELLTLERLFFAENELLVLERIRTMPVPPPSRYNRNVPRELDRVILRALAKDVNERYRTAKDFYRELNAVADDAGETASKSEIADYMCRAFPEFASRSSNSAPRDFDETRDKEGTRNPLELSRTSLPPAVHARQNAPRPVGLDMDWEEDDDDGAATQVFDRAKHEISNAPAPHPSNGLFPSYASHGVLSSGPLTPPPPPAPPSPPPPPTLAIPPPMLIPGPSRIRTPLPGPSYDDVPEALPASQPIRTSPLGASPRVSSYGAARRAGPDETSLARPDAVRLRPWLAAVFAIAVLAFGVALWMPKSGRIVVVVSDAKGGNIRRVEIFVDGRKYCETTPCYIEQPAGTHEVKVLADGYEVPSARNIDVESRRDAQVNFALSPTAVAALRADGTQQGVHLIIDDKDFGTLPQEVHDLAPGTHRVRLQGGERYAPLDKSVTVVKDEVVDLGKIALKVLRGVASISVPSPPDTRVFISSGTDRRWFDRLPTAVELDTSRSWVLEAQHVGYKDFRQVLSFEDGRAEKTFAIVLEPLPARAPSFAPAVHRASRAPLPRAPAPAPDETDNSDNATLAINSIPVAYVKLDGKPIGQTPLRGVKVTPGTHVVVFVNPDLELRKEVTVTVGPGEHRSLGERLREE